MWCRMVSVHVCQVSSFCNLHFKRNKQRHTKKAKMGNLDSIGLEHCMVLVIVQIWDQSAEAAWFQNMRFLELQSYAAGILDNSPAIQGVYITLMCFVL